MKPYSKLNLIQGSPEWLDARYNYCTASQVPVLFNESPYQTPLQLFEEKTLRKELDQADKSYVFEQGHKAESAAREWIKNKWGITLEQSVIVSTECPDLLVSLDGLSEEKNFIFEAKFTGAKNITALKNKNIPLNERIPAHHLTQVKTQLLGSGAEFCVYFAVDPLGNAAVEKITPDEAIHAEIMEKAKAFMTAVRTGKAPEPGPRDFFTPKKDPRFSQLRSLKETMDEMETKYERLKTQLLDEYKDHRRVKYDGVTISRFIRKGSVQYKKVPELKGVDLEQYRGKSSESTRITFGDNHGK